MNPRSQALVAAVLAVLSLFPAAAWAGPEPISWKVGDAVVQPILSDRLRVEIVDWFDPGAGLGDESYAFVANVIRFGAITKWKDLNVTIEGQEVALWGVPSDAPGLGPGAAYYAATADEDQQEVAVRRAFLQWNDAFTKGLSVSGGRSILNDGAETNPKDAGLAWLKKNRISQRLVGGFDYTHVGRSFDGGSVHYAAAPWEVTLAGGRPTAGGFNVSANNEVEDVGIVYAALTATEPEWLPRADARVFYVYYADERGLVATDNRPLADRQADDGDIAVHTIGANVEGLWRLGPGDVDGLFWLAGQTGEWESLDHGAWAFALEGGYRLVDVVAKPWLRLGWNRGSGDDDAGDGDHGTFFQVLPTVRLYALTPFYNMMNNDDLFLQLLLSPTPSVSTRVDWHHLWVTEEQDLLYGGAGAIQSKPAFGYSGYSARGRSEVADLVDLSVDWTVHPRVKLAAYYGHAFGAAVIDGQYPKSDDLDYAYLEVTLSL